MKVRFVDLIKNQEQIDVFNARLSANCSLSYNSDYMTPYIKDGVIYLNKKFDLFLLLFSILYEKQNLIDLTKDYCLICAKLCDGDYSNLSILLDKLENDFINIRSKIGTTKTQIFLDLQYSVLIAHELCHYRFAIDPSYKSSKIKAIEDFKAEIKTPKGIKGIVFNYFFSRIFGSKHFIVEYACDSAGADYIADCYKKGLINKKDILPVIIQVQRIFSALSFWGRIDRIKKLNMRLMMQDYLFNVERSLLFSASLLSELDEEFPEDAIDPIKNEPYKLNEIYEKTFSFTNDNLVRTTLQQYDGSIHFSQDEITQLNKRFEILRDRIFLYIVDSINNNKRVNLIDY